MNEAIQNTIEYLEPYQDAECISGGNEYTPNEEMKLIQDLKSYENVAKSLITLAVLFIQKSHHLDGCQKARENWKECTCGKDRFLKLVEQVR